jgi:uncharacterized membrane protein
VSDDVWSAAKSADAGATRAAELPNVMDLASRVVSEVQKDFAMFLLGGLGSMILSLVLVPVALVLVYGGMFLGMLPGMMANDDGLTAIGSVGGLSIGMTLMFVGLLVVAAPMWASTHRAVWKYLTEGEKFTYMAPFSTYTQDLGKVLGFTFVQGVLITGGMMLCYVPGLALAAALMFSGPAVYVHRVGIGEALSLSWRHFQANVGWHVGFFAIAFVMQMVLTYIPFVGMMLLATVMPLYVLLAYRHIYGDGPIPRGGSLPV